MAQDGDAEQPSRATEQEAEAIAAHLDGAIESIEGYDVRADAGEDGSVWLALRGGIERRELAEDVIDAIEAALREGVPEMAGAFEFKISMGISGNDLAFKCEFFRPDGDGGSDEGAESP